jgi:serine/threonine-protein kinase
LPTGHLLFAAADRTLRAVGFDARRLQMMGNPVTVVEDVGITVTGAGNFAVANTGSLVYATGRTGMGMVPPRILVWVDRTGHEELINVPTRGYTYARLSPDGTRVALDARDEQNDIWIFDLARHTLQQLTHDPGMNRLPVWTPDSKRVAFTAERDGVESVYWQAADGSGTMERLSSGMQPQGPQSFSPDGMHLIFSTPLAGPSDLGVIALATRTATMLLHSTTASEGNGEISPDGRWLAYESNESGRSEIYLRPFPDVETARQQVSTAGGTRPLWSPTRRELFYYVAPGTIMAVPVRLGVDVTLGNPKPVVKGPYAVAVNAGRHYDVSADGQQFLLLKDAPTPDGQRTATTEIHLVLNWTEELKRLVPTR